MYVQSCCFALSRSAYHLYGKPGNSGENSDETIHPGEDFSGKKVIPYEVLPFSRFYRYDQNIWYHLSGQCLACLEAESDLFQPRPTRYLVFCNGTTLTHSSFRKGFQVQYHLSETFYRNFLTNGKRSSYCFFLLSRRRSILNFLLFTIHCDPSETEFSQCKMNCSC